MTLLAYVIYFAALVALGWALALWMARVYSGALPALLLRAEGMILGASGAAPGRGMGWGAYAMAVLAFNAAGFLLLYAILRTQGALPLNPDGIAGMAPDLAFNTAVSFVTNTNWQAYSGEAQLSYLSQMAGLTVQNFVSAGTGMAVAVAVIRGFAAAKGAAIGNFWEVLAAEEAKGGAVKVTIRITVEIEGSDKPGCVVDTISLLTFE